MKLLIQLLPPTRGPPQGAVPPGEPSTVSRSMKPTTLFGAPADGAEMAPAKVMLIVVVAGVTTTSVPVMSMVPVLKVSPVGSTTTPARAGTAVATHRPSNRTPARQRE